MARRQFKIPFADTGDTVSIPETTQPDGSVSMQQGYGFDYQRDPQTDPLAKAFPRDVHNGLMNEITSSIGEIQQNGYPIWVAEGAPYPINTVVRHSDKNWRSNIANNSDEPGVGPGATSWFDETVEAIERFNAPIETIASASTVNLTTGAPNTSQITITGTASISAFTVAASRAFVVSFSGACTLVNSDALVTGTGSNIQCADGDSCIVRATAANAVEILCGNFLSESALGARGQTWQNLTGSRSSGVTYTNTTGRPIDVSIHGTNASGIVGLTLMVYGVVVAIQGTPANQSSHVSSIIPPGATYSCSISGASTYTWAELRT